VQAFEQLTPIIPLASYNTQTGPLAPNSSSVSHSLAFTWQMSSLGIPVLPNFAAQMSTARADEYLLHNTELSIRSDVRTAYDTSLGLEKSIEIDREAVSAAQEQLMLSEVRLQAGVGTNIDVLDAQSTLSSILQNYVTAIYQYNLEQCSLRRAIGGFSLRSVVGKLRYN
jgi:outer membrane protein TolC